MSSLKIQDFTDYRTFLSEVYRDMKARNSRVSYEVFAQRLGLKDNSSIIKVLRGQRQAGKKMIGKIAEALGLNDGETKYFENLVEISKSKANKTRYAEAVEKLRASHPQARARILTDGEFSAISNWYYYAIRRMVRLVDFESSATWIQNRLNFFVDVRQLRQAVTSMVELGLLVEEDGQLKLGDHALTTTANLASEGLKRFHEQMLSNAREAIRNVPVNRRTVCGMTFGIKESDYEEAAAELDRMIDEFTERFEAAEPDQIYQVQVQLFPLTKES